MLAKQLALTIEKEHIFGTHFENKYYFAQNKNNINFKYKKLFLLNLCKF